jgi:hypothetical protein
MWKGFKITERYNANLAHCGWEATCYHALHSDSQMRCKRTLNFSTKAPQELTLRRLLWWCLRGGDFDSRALHVHQCPKEPLAGALPSLEELHAMPPPSLQAERGR